VSNQFSLPGGEELAAQQVRAVLKAAGGRGRSIEELHERIPELPEQRLRALLGYLEEEGQALEWQERWLHPETTDWRVARVREGEGDDLLLVPEGEKEAAWFVSRRRSRGAREGDRVLIEPAGLLPGRRRQTDLDEGVVVRILSRGCSRLVGTLEIDEEDRRWLVPFDPQLNLEIEVLEAEDLLEDHYVVVELDPGGEGRRHPRGRVVEVLGHPDRPGVDVDIMVRHHDLPDTFSPEVLALTRSLPPDPTDADRAGREDLTGEILVTIDGESARDFDDAVSVDPLPGGGFRLGVHIADVAHYVPEGSALDLEAYYRGTSVYFPDRVLPMLPEALSNGLCSLRPAQPRLALSVFLDLDRDGAVTSRRFAPTLIRSARRLTYGEVRRLLEEPAASDGSEYGEALLGRLRTMGQLAHILREKRQRRGSLDFDLPTGDVILDTDGNTVGIRPGERNVAHRLIEELMIAANEAVAEELLSRGVPALYRVHDAPPRKDLEELRVILKTFGIALRGDLSELPPAALQEILGQVEGRPEEAFVTTLVLRTLARALYHPDCRGHYALAAVHYCHFTSPIRRYPDLVVHRALKSLLVASGAHASGEHGSGEHGSGEHVSGEHIPGGRDASLGARLAAIGEHTSTTERRAEWAERDLLQWKKVRFLASRMGETFTGRITGVTPFGLFVLLDDFYVDGLVPIRTLSDDFYLHEPEAHRLSGQNHGRVFRLADEVRIVLAGISARHRGLELRLADLPEPTSSGRDQKGRRRKRRR